MKKDGYYSSGQFARMAGVTLRTIRYYDQHDILKPSLVSESGARFYTDTDFARLQQILLLKYLGFSLEDIREMTIEDPDSHFMLNALNVQLKLVQDRIEQMQLVEKTLKDTAQAISEEHTVDWSRMLDLIHLTVMEKSLKNQYQNASNISCGWSFGGNRTCALARGLRIQPENNPHSRIHSCSGPYDIHAAYFYGNRVRLRRSRDRTFDINIRALVHARRDIRRNRKFRPVRSNRACGDDAADYNSGYGNHIQEKTAEAGRT